MKVINFFGGPSVGKSTMTAAIFYELKKKDSKVELIQEYAKEMVYENRNNILSDQIYIFAKQHRRLLRLIDHNVNYVIADSPLPTSLFYTRDDYFPSFAPLVMEAFNSFDNYNILLERAHPYDPNGRVQKSEEEACEIGRAHV